jgi:hypothetical protein
MRTLNDSGGYLLADLLVGLLLTAFVAQATMMTLSTHTRTHKLQDLTADLEQNLRVGMRTLSDTLRATGYGVPTSDLQTWVPWVSDFGSNPTIVEGPPATISVARCTPLPVAFLTLPAVNGSTTMTIESNVPDESVSMVLDNGNKRLIHIGGSEFAHITRMSGNILTIDTDLGTTGDQGLGGSYPAGTPICRIDVLTFAVDSTANDLTLDENHGDGPQPLANDIGDLTISTVEAGARYEIEITALSEDADPTTGTKLTRILRSDIALRNTP